MIQFYISEHIETDFYTHVHMLRYLFVDNHFSTLADRDITAVTHLHG